MQSASEDLGIAFFDTFDTVLKNATDVMTDAIGGLSEMFKLIDESPLETAIRQIDALGGETLDLRTELAELNLEQAKMGVENLPTVNEAMERQAENNKKLIDLEKQLIPLREQDKIATDAIVQATEGQFGMMSGLVAKTMELVGVSQNSTEELEAQKEALLADSEAMNEAILKRRELEQA